MFLTKSFAQVYSTAKQWTNRSSISKIWNIVILLGIIGISTKRISMLKSNVFTLQQHLVII